MTGKVTDVDRGWKRIKRDTAALARKSVKVGIQSDAGSDESGSIVDRAVYNEFGTRRIPARPFMRGAYDDNQADLSRTKGQVWGRIIDGTLSPQRGAALLGQRHEGQVKEKITSIKTPPNAPSTIAAKGSSNPLIASGQMRQSVRYKVDE